MKLCIIPGDGIGIEVTDAARRILDVLPIDVQVSDAQAGWGTFQETGAALPASTLALAQDSDAVLFGAVASPSHPVPGYRSPIVALRKALELYANIRPTTSTGLPNANQRPHVDMIVVRENTEGLYSGNERTENDGQTTIAERVITRRGSERIVRAACELTMKRLNEASTDEERAHRSKLTIVHKANVLRVTDGFFRQVALEVAENYPAITIEELLVDTAAMHVAQSPQRFNVIVTTNMFGDILSDIACIHGGGLGLASSANMGDEYAVFEPVHGAAPDIAGKGIANPLATFGCLVMMFEREARREMQATREAHAQESETETDDTATEQPAFISPFASWARCLRTAIQTTLYEGPHTPDMGGNATTNDITEAVIQRLRTCLRS